MTQYLSTLTLEELATLTLDELATLGINEPVLFPVICTVVNATPEAPVTVSILSAYYVESWS